MAESYPARFEARKRRRRRLKFALIFVFASMLVSGAAYFVKEGNAFRIERFVINGLEHDEEAAFLRSLEPFVLRNVLARFLGFSNYLVWPDSLAPPAVAFANLTVEKNLLARTIALTVEKRSRSGIWCGRTPAPRETALETTETISRPASSRCFWFDERDGVLFEEAPETTGQLIPSIQETTAELPPLGTPFIKASAFLNLQAIIAAFAREEIGFRELMLDRTIEELRVHTSRNTLLIFSIRDDPSQAISSLAALRAETPLEQFEYVDLTLPRKLLLKRR